MYDKDLHIEDALFKTPQVLEKFNSIAVGISGGADSDVVLDMIVRSGCDLSKVHFIFSDTGLELQATKNHLDELEKKYGVKIERIRAVKSIPTCCKDHGQPFLNKVVSMHIERLQSRGFKWEDEPFEVLVERYPHTISSLKWWCNKNPGVKFNIMNNKWLKEFLISTPPQFRISFRCCEYAKKKPFLNYYKLNHTDLYITGLRRAEGGVRSTAYKSCFSTKGNLSEYRPIWWFFDSDRADYESHYNVVHSDCYTKYGFRRTGCAGCPYSKTLSEDLIRIQQFEPKLYAAVNNVFKDSYEYTCQYQAFKQKMDALKNTK